MISIYRLRTIIEFLLPLTVVHEDSTEITNKVDDEENGSFLRSHCQIATFSITCNRMGLRSSGQ